MRFQSVVARIAPAALALLLSAIPAFGAESAAPAEKASESVTNTAAQPSTSPAGKPATSPAGKPAISPAGEPAEAPSKKLPNIVSIRFVGNEHFSTGSLKRDMETRANKPVVIKVISADVNQIVKKYEDDGFLEAKVNATSEPLAGTTDQELLFTIVEGPRYKLSTVEIVGNKLFSTLELRPLVKPEKDGYFSKGAFQDGAKRIWEHYGEVGRLTTLVLPKMAPPPGPNLAAVQYVITEGPPVTLESVKLEWVNDRITEEWLVRCEVDRKLHEGMALTVEPINDVIARLRKYKWFKSVQYRVEPGAAPDQAIVVVSLEEGGTSRVSASGSAASYSGLGAALTFQESDFDITKPPKSWQDFWDWNMFRGRGERLILSAAPGQKFTTLGGGFEQPDTFGTDYTGLASATYNREELPDYNLWQLQIRIGVEKDLSDHWRVSFGPTIEGTEMWDLSQHNIPDYNAVNGYTPGYGAWSRLSYTTTPDTIIVNRGMRASLYVEPIYEDTPFVHSLLSASQFVPVYGEGFDAHVLEVSANGGVIGGKAPVFDRFYAGGLGSVRGFDVWGISPQFDGVPIGGYWMLTGTAEYTFPIIHVGQEVYFRGAMFTDYGDVETTPAELGRIRIGSGVGLRAVLPKAGGLTAGINFGWPVISYRGDSTLVFTFFMTMGL
ncbi:MAG: outer membrane protein assembly factor [Candidatus Brocadiia bacterium]